MTRHVLRRWLILLVVGGIWLFPRSVWADGGMPQNFIGARPLGQHEYGIFGKYIRIRKVGLFQGTGRAADPADTEMGVTMVPLVWGAGLKPDLTVTAMLPYVEKTLVRTVDGARARTRTSGIGDLQLVGIHQLYRRDQGSTTTQIAGLFGVTLPTGSTNERTAGGELLGPDLQLGNGALAPFAGAAFITEGDRHAWHGQLLYKVNLKGPHGVHPGSELNYDLLYGYRLFPAERGEGREWYLQLELNGRASGRTRAGGETLADSGGHTIFLSPGLMHVVKEHLLVELSYQIPVYRHVNGTQPAPRSQLSMGLRYFY